MNKSLTGLLRLACAPTASVCSHCGSVDRIYELKGKRTRLGLRKCGQRRKQFTVEVGTIFEDSHVPMHIWLQAIYLMCSSKKGISSNHLHRTLSITHATRKAGATRSGAASARRAADERKPTP